MDTGQVFLGLRHKVAPLLLDQIRITEPDHWVIVVKQKFRLPPADHPALRRIRFNAGQQPGWVAVLVSGLRPTADERATVIVEPVQIASFRTFPDEISGARMFYGAAACPAHIAQFRPAAPAIPAVRLDRITVDGAVGHIKRTVVERYEPLFLGNRPAAGRSPQSGPTVRQRDPMGLAGIFHIEQIGTFQQRSLGTLVKPLPHLPDPDQRNPRRAVERESPADIPEEAD